MAFAVKYRVEFTDRKGTDWKVEIEQDGYVGSVIPLRSSSANPITIKFRATDTKLKFAPICPKDVELRVIADYDYQLMELAYSSDKDFKLKVYEVLALRFEGFLLKGLGGETYTNPPYTVKIKATDWLVALKKTPYTHLGGNDVVRGSDVLMNIINNDVGLANKTFLDNSDLYPTSITPGATDTSLYVTYVNQALFVQEEMSSYDVLKDLMTTHNCRFFQRSNQWVVDSIASHEAGTTVQYRVRNATTYVDIVPQDIVQPTLLHTDVKQIGGAAIPMVEAPKEITVETNIVEHLNILEDQGLDNWGALNHWGEMNGTMILGSGAQGYAAQDKFNNQTINGDSCLGIGEGITNSSFSLSATGLTHNITAILDTGAGNIYTLTFTASVVAPAWTILNSLIIQPRGNFEITGAPTLPAGGLSTVNVRIKDTDSTPRVGDRIIGIWDNLFVLEQTLEFPAGMVDREVEKSTTQLLEIEVEYASQISGITAYNIVPDESLHFIGIKVGAAPYDAYNGVKWQDTGNGVNTTYTQFLQLEGTNHNVFTKKTFEITLDWSLVGSQLVRLALIGGYATPMVYKSIIVRIKDVDEAKTVLSNVANNSTSFSLSGTLFKGQGTSDNLEFMAMGGLLEPGGVAHLTFDPSAKSKNASLADLIKTQYADNCQIWRGKVEGTLDGSEILKDPKNHDRTFQIQEVTNNINDQNSDIMAVEIVPSGVIVSVLTITSAGSLVFAAHSVSGKSSDSIQINNTGNIGFEVTAITLGVDFFNGGNKYIISGGNEDVAIVAKSTTSGPKVDLITIREKNIYSNSLNFPVNVIVYEDDATFYINEFDPILQLGARYEYEAASVGAKLIDAVSVHNSGITIDANMNGLFTSVPTSQSIASLATESFSLQSTYTTLGDRTEAIEFDDSANGHANNFYSTRVTIKGGIRMPNAPTGGANISVNRARVNGGSWVNFIVASSSPLLDFELDDLVEWNIQTSLGSGAFTMDALNRASSVFKTIAGGSGVQDITMSIDTSTQAGYNDVSIDLRIT